MLHWKSFVHQSMPFHIEAKQSLIWEIKLKLERPGQTDDHTQQITALSIWSRNLLPWLVATATASAHRATARAGCRWND